MPSTSLDEIILAGDIERCIAFFEAMSEAQRKSYSARAMAWIGAFDGFNKRKCKHIMTLDIALSTDSEFLKSIEAGTIAFPRQFNENSFLASQMSMLAACSFSQLEKSGELAMPKAHLAVRLLQVRKPDWMSKWCDYVVRKFPDTHWLAAYELEKAGYCELEHNENYWIAMLCTLPNTENMYERLASDERVRTQLWGMLSDDWVIRLLLEPERVNLEWLKEYRREEYLNIQTQPFSRQASETWCHVLLKLACDDLIDRDKLIDYSFKLLIGVAEKEHRRKYFPPPSDFALTLNREIIQGSAHSHINQLLALLGAQNKAVFAYASSLLREMPVGAVRAEEICLPIESAFLNKSKEPADIALTMLERLAREEPLKSIYGVKPYLLHSTTRAKLFIERLLR